MKLEEEKPFSLFDIYIMVKMATKRRWTIAIAPSIAVLWVFLIFTLFLPNYFISDALVIVQPQNLETEMMQEEKAVEVKEKMEALLQTVLSRPKLKQIVYRFNLYPNLRDGEDAERAVAKLRKDINVGQPESATGDNVLQTFRLSYSYTDPDTTFQVTQALTDLFIGESLSNSKVQLQNQLDFIEKEVADARKQLETTENSEKKFVQENFGQLPQQLEATVARLQSSQSRLASNTEMISANTQRREYLQKELRDLQSAGSASVQSNPGSNEAADPYENLNQLERALVVLSSKYSEQHPDVIATKQRIQALKAQIKSSDGKGGKPLVTASGNTGALASREVKRQLAELDVSISAMNNENKRLTQAIDDLENSIKNMPLKEQEIIKIKRDYENKKAYYDRLLKSQKQLELKADLISSHKYAQFKVIEMPDKPIHPAGPMRVAIAVAGVVMGLGTFFCVIVFGLLISPAFRRKKELEDELEIRVLGVIPPLATSQQKRNQRKSAVVSVVISLFILLSGVVILLLIIRGGLGALI